MKKILSLLCISLRTRCHSEHSEESKLLIVTTNDVKPKINFNGILKRSTKARFY